MTADKPNPPDPKKEQPVEGKEIEEFFQRFPVTFAGRSRMPRRSRLPWKRSNACREAARPRRIWRQTVTRTNRAAPAQLAEVCSRRALAFVSGAESRPDWSRAMPRLEPLPANIMFTTTIIILSPARERHPARPRPRPSPLLLAVVLLVRRAPVLWEHRRAAAPKPAPARLCRTGRRPATPSTSMICSSSTPPTLLSSAPTFRRFAACLRSGSFLSRCSKPDWATLRWNRCASKCWVRLLSISAVAKCSCPSPWASAAKSAESTWSSWCDSPPAHGRFSPIAGPPIWRSARRRPNPLPEK